MGCISDSLGYNIMTFPGPTTYARWVREWFTDHKSEQLLCASPSDQAIILQEDYFLCLYLFDSFSIQDK